MEVPYEGGLTVIVDINTGEILSDPLPLWGYSMKWSKDGKKLVIGWSIAYILEQDAN
jgi:hypothetical protein